jgi:hypothetical protein
MHRPLYVTLAVLVLIIGAAGWAKRHEYQKIGSAVVRTNIWTGESEMLRRDGWHPMTRASYASATSGAVDSNPPADSLAAIERQLGVSRPAVGR